MGAVVRSNPITSAIRAKRDDPRRRLQVANGVATDVLPAGDLDAAAGVEAAWLPTIPGQTVPMLGEVVSDAESCFNE